MRSSGVEVSRACVVEHLKSPWFIVELTLGTQVSVTVPILDQRIEVSTYSSVLGSNCLSRSLQESKDENAYSWQAA